MARVPFEMTQREGEDLFDEIFPSVTTATVSDDCQWFVSASALNALFGSSGYIRLDKLKEAIERLRHKV